MCAESEDTRWARSTMKRAPLAVGASTSSSFYPSRHVVDGDLCERFSSLPAAARAAIAKALDRTPLEVVRKLEDARNSVL